MLTTDECMNLNDYVFKSSPESCYSNSSSAEYTDLPSDEDFLQQLSSDLDIPLLLNQGEDEMSLLNSFFDKSPDEIMSEIVSPSTKDQKFDDIAEEFSDLEHLNFAKWDPESFPNLQADIKSEPDSCSSSDSFKSSSPIQSPTSITNLFEVKDEVKFENPLSNAPPHIMKSLHNTFDTTNIIISAIPDNQRDVSKIVTKRVPIQPKVPYTVPIPKNKVVLIKSPNYKLNSSVVNSSIQKPATPKVVVLENISAVPITNANVTPLSPINPSTVKNCMSNTVSPVILNGNNTLPINVNNIDSKALKRQQRKIKNRESACLSRKKKKDYLTSLENQVKILTKENHYLKTQNLHLKERLAKYEGNNFAPNTSNNNVKNTIVLCMFIFSLSFNLDYLRGPFSSKNNVEIVQSKLPEDLNHHSRNLLWSQDDSSDKTNNTNFSPFSMCPAAINQSESARLVLELERWIGKPNNIDEKPMEWESTKLNVTNTKTKPLRKRKYKKNLNSMVSSVYSVKKLPQVDSNKELQVFSPTPEQIYNEFFEAINRQDDTFYVVSFSDHHMLLPALQHNKTRRPKMSLIMPSMLPNGNVSKPALMTLMQIDCEVLDTRLIHINYGLIPQHLRNHGNSTHFETNNPDNDLSKAAHNSTNYNGKKAYKPYFINQIP